MLEMFVEESADAVDLPSAWRTMPAPSPAYLSAVLDEIDYGMLLVDAKARVLHVNQAARAQACDQQAILSLG